MSLPGDQTVVMAAAGAWGALPEVGQVFGHYQIIRLLGHGGMGSVFEAQDNDSGRRIALKVLCRQLDSPDSRSRFLREGRLAASINHPNSVYVFGTEEIGGVPVIAMELVGGGTLQDRVSRTGALPAREVADCALQLIAGLESAHRVGVLHRDIKPSNCFVETDGTVKIGDFGLSISTAFMADDARITATGAFLGTPAYASPEQLRGDELTVCSDIYSLGVTLYFLLTGRHPFDAPDMVRLLATVLERPPESPARFRPELPAGLCQVVLRCLEKNPQRRFRNYAELRNALLPFVSGASTPATLGIRAAAYILDALFLALPTTLLNVLVNFLVYGAGQTAHVRFVEAVMANWNRSNGPTLLVDNLCGMFLAVCYFALLEGLWGASLGKRICGLRVARLDNTVPGIPRALVRTLVITATPTVAWLICWSAIRPLVSDSSLWLPGLSLLILPTRLLMFVTARRTNGYAAIQDLLSGTRVTVARSYHSRPALAAATEPAPELTGLPMVGPYHVLGRVSGNSCPELLLGFDARLLRRVWIRQLTPGAPPVPAHLAYLSRPGRLRWLTGQRTDTTAWDAYEAPTGRPFLDVISRPQDWGAVRFWLLDLAAEFQAASLDGTAPDMLSLNRVWITADGRAKWLDFPVTDLGISTRGSSGPPAPAPQQFLALLAASALKGRIPERADVARDFAMPLARHASELLESLRAGVELRNIVASLQGVLNLPPRISRARRALLLGAALLFPIITAVLAGTLGTVQRSILQTAPDLATLNECLVHYLDLSHDPARTADANAFALYISGEFAPLFTNASRWNSPVTRAVMSAPQRAAAEQILSRTPPPTPGQFAEASAAVERFFHKAPAVAAREGLQKPRLLFASLVVGYIITLVFVVLPCLMASLLFRGGALVRLLGIMFVTTRGSPASRWRVALRNLVAWLPFGLIPLAGRAELGLPLMAGVCFVLTGISLCLPKRGFADCLAGTWPVPR